MMCECVDIEAISNAMRDWLNGGTPADSVLLTKTDGWILATAGNKRAIYHFFKKRKPIDSVTLFDLRAINIDALLRVSGVGPSRVKALRDWMVSHFGAGFEMDHEVLK